jgi:hypothetical protein
MKKIWDDIVNNSENCDNAIPTDRRLKIIPKDQFICKFIDDNGVKCTNESNGHQDLCVNHIIKKTHKAHIRSSDYCTYVYAKTLIANVATYDIQELMSANSDHILNYLNDWLETYKKLRKSKHLPTHK